MCLLHKYQYEIQRLYMIARKIFAKSEGLSAASPSLKRPGGGRVFDLEGLIPSVLVGIVSVCDATQYRRWVEAPHNHICVEKLSLGGGFEKR